MKTNYTGVGTSETVGAPCLKLYGASRLSLFLLNIFYQISEAEKVLWAYVR